MTDYTKTTNFAAKDSLPSGNANKIVKGAEIDTEFTNIATASATKANIASPTFTGTVTIPTADINGGAVDGTTIGASSASSIVGTTVVANTSISIAGDGATVTGIKDEDDMSSNSATKLATQQSIKAYVDSQVTAQDLDVTDGSSSIDIDLDSESLGILGGTGIDSTASGTGVTLAIDSTVATLTGSQTLTNKTLTAPTLTGTAVVASLDISGDVDVDGTLETDALSINGTTVTSTAAELNILDGVTSTAAELNILDGVTSTTAELNILDGVTSTAAELNILDGKAFLDEDDMSSDSATGIASQQSIKAYVDSQVTAQDLDFQADSGGALSIDLDSETLTFTGGTGIDTSGSGNAVTFAIDSTVATLTGSQTLTNKTLTSPDINTPDIDGGAIDGTTIGGSTPAAGSFTTGSFSGDVSFGDNDKAIFGAGDDLQIYHNGNNSFIEDSGTGSLYVRASSDFRVQSHSDNKDMIRATSSGAVTLYNNNASKLATTSTGIDVTGTATMDGLTVSNTDSSTLKLESTDTSLSENQVVGQIDFYANDASTNSTGNKAWIKAYSETSGGNSIGLDLATSNGSSATGVPRLNIASNGDISFYEDTGTTPKFFWDASAESLGIGTSSPSAPLTVKGETLVQESGSDGNSAIRVQYGTGGTTSVYDRARLMSSAWNGVLELIDSSNTLTTKVTSSGDSYFNGGNVGIGTSSPSRPLTVNGNNGTGMIINDAANDKALRFRASGDAFFIEATNNAESAYANLALEGNVGIGRSSAIRDLLTVHKNDTSTTFGETTAAIEVTNSNASGFGKYSGVNFRVGGGSYNESLATVQTQYTAYSGNVMGELVFGTRGASTTNVTERMRIDSSGNLLVGQTSADSNSVGIGLLANGTAYAVRDGGAAILAHRKSSDGSIMEFLKDNSTVGSIGVNSSRPYLVNNVDGGIHLSTDGYGRALLLPADQNGAPEDNLHHLGSASYRWRDLYLSGGVYLGGTAAANKLDDYEEGTFTLSASAGTLTYLYSSASTYTKIGNRVIIDLGQLQITGVPNNSTTFTLSGLPFTTQGQSSLAVGFVNTAFGTSSENQWFNMYIEANTIYIGKRNTDYLIRNEDITGATISFSGGGSAYRTS